MNRIFLSYRREDGAAEAWLLQAKLSDQLGEAAAFLDTTSITPGTVWPDRLRQALSGASAVLVVMGPNWIRASDEWSRRRIDQEDDWVRLEIEHALDADKLVLPVLVRGATMPPADSLPPSIAPLVQRQAVELRNAHDIELIVSLLKASAGRSDSTPDTGLYPLPAPELPEVMSQEKIDAALRRTLRHWRTQVRQPEDGADHDHVGLYREYRFRSFRDAVSFMNETAPGCDIAIHHPVWENVWRTVRVFLTTWDIGHRISDRDVQLAKYLDRAYDGFAGAEPVE